MVSVLRGYFCNYGFLELIATGACQFVHICHGSEVPEYMRSRAPGHSDHFPHDNVRVEKNDKAGLKILETHEVL